MLICNEFFWQKMFCFSNFDSDVTNFIQKNKHMDIVNNVVKAWGVGGRKQTLDGGGLRGRKWETSVILTTI